ncbi:MAG: hypothetical protein R3297_07875 [Desulfobulbales bacterium]|nr:hypothetical protein [Desulfobulbales bacterium]
MKRKNCWEVIKCGREPGGKNEEQGVCPAALPGEHDGKNNGRHGGRFCWNIAGSFCKGLIQGTVARKIRNCRECGFYILVSKEEDEQFIDAIAPGPK